MRYWKYNKDDFCNHMIITDDEITKWKDSRCDWLQLESIKSGRMVIFDMYKEMTEEEYFLEKI